MTTAVSMDLQPLILRSNRFLGAALVDLGLISFTDLERASGVLLEDLQSGVNKRNSLITILQSDLKVLEEKKLIQHLVEKHHVGVFSPGFSQPILDPDFSPDECWATWSVPYDCVDGIWFVASAYYISKPVISFWEKKLGAPIEWSVAETVQVADAIGRYN